MKRLPEPDRPKTCFRNGIIRRSNYLLGEMEKKDYYIEEGKVVFTEDYHKKRGYCCNNSCRHCPYKNYLSLVDIKTSQLTHTL